MVAVLCLFFVSDFCSRQHDTKQSNPHVAPTITLSFMSKFHYFIYTLLMGPVHFYPLRTSRPNEYLPPGYLILLGTVIFPSQIILSFKSMDCCMFCIIKQALSD